MFSCYSLQGWEESCDAAVSHLLRSCLSRSPKDQATSLAQAGGPVLGLPHDTTRLKKHITLMCDRISKGGRLTLASEANVPVPLQIQNLAAPGESGRGRKRGDGGEVRGGREGWVIEQLAQESEGCDEARG